MRDSAASITSRMAGDIFGSVRKENYQNLGTQGLIDRAQEQSNAWEADAKVQSYGLAAKGTVLAAEAEAEAIKAQGAAQGQMSAMSGLAGGVSSLFGGLNLGGGGPALVGEVAPITSGAVPRSLTAIVILILGQLINTNSVNINVDG